MLKTTRVNKHTAGFKSYLKRMVDEISNSHASLQRKIDVLEKVNARRVAARIL